MSFSAGHTHTHTLKWHTVAVRAAHAVGHTSSSITSSFGRFITGYIRAVLLSVLFTEGPEGNVLDLFLIPCS